MTKTPHQFYGALFEELHQSGRWKDQKQIADAIPRSDPDQIMLAYSEAKRTGQFDPEVFFHKHFRKATDPTVDFQSHKEGSVESHIQNLWPLLERKGENHAQINGSSLIPLPHAYIVPGGRFNEIYYWDSYFTMLGLQVASRTAMVESMIDNFCFLIEQYGYIPNGNRTYFLGRSQPPFLSLMVKLLAESRDETIYVKYLPFLLKEHDFWMLGSASLAPSEMDKHVVKLPSGDLLNRYFDQYASPRQEMFQHDLDAQRQSGRDAKQFYLDIRSACESGWDFSSRWFKDRKNFSTIQASKILPVDLHCLLFHLESTLAHSFQILKKKDRHLYFQELADGRLASLNTYFWNEDAGFFFDYQFENQSTLQIYSAAGLFPLYFKMVSDYQARAVAQVVEKRLLAPGGLLTTEHATGQQWDAPNGWAPLQWIAVRGLLNYGQNDLALLIAERWVALNERVFRRTGKMMEKYNVVDLDLEAGGGEYPGQAGFGWTNGVYLKLLQLLRQYGRR